MSRLISDLNSEAKAKYLAFSGLMAEAQLPFILTCTLRTQEEHEALWSQGRDPLEMVNELRSNVGWTSITEEQNKKKITWVTISKHFPDETGKSRAWDIAICKGKMPTWNIKCDVDVDGIPDYIEAARIGRRLGLRCGADFPMKDYVHFEVKQIKEEVR
ncbi:MAG: M15 family metallopeptidase [Candidatus Omnitrophota bacterium]